MKNTVDSIKAFQECVFYFENKISAKYQVNFAIINPTVSASVFKVKYFYFGYFDPENVFQDNENK